MYYVIILFSLFTGVLIYIFVPAGTIRNYGPDFFWAFAFVWSINIISKTSTPISSILTVTIAGLLYELGQKFEVFQGTFDLIDIIIYALGACTGQLIQPNRRWRGLKKNFELKTQSDGIEYQG